MTKPREEDYHWTNSQGYPYIKKTQGPHVGDRLVDRVPNNWLIGFCILPTDLRVMSSTLPYPPRVFPDSSREGRGVVCGRRDGERRSGDDRDPWTPIPFDPSVFSSLMVRVSLWTSGSTRVQRYREVRFPENSKSPWYLVFLSQQKPRRRGNKRRIWV